MIKSVGTNAFPRAGTTQSAALEISIVTIEITLRDHNQQQIVML